MQVVRSFVLMALFLSYCTSCQSQRPDYQTVAEDFAQTLHQYVEHPTHKNQTKLKQTASTYTVQAISNGQWLTNLTQKGAFEYSFLRDSMSKDKMRVYVWYTNGALPSEGTIFRIILRRTLDGWLVDMPIGGVDDLGF